MRSEETGDAAAIGSDSGPVPSRQDRKGDVVDEDVNVVNEPLTPPDCDLRAYPTMPLNVARLRDSGLSSHENAEVFRAAVMLWCAAWHQVPAASLPNDDRELANLAGFGRFVKEWMKIRDEALHGFTLCSDGRLYHHVVAEVALPAWETRKKYLERSRKANEARHGHIEGKTRPDLMAEARALGTHTDAEWGAMLSIFGGKCLACGTDEGVAKDHVVPIQKRGSDAIANIQPLCGPCNSGKGSLKAIDYRPAGWEALLVGEIKDSSARLEGSLARSPTRTPSSILASRENGTERNGEEELLPSGVAKPDESGLATPPAKTPPPAKPKKAPKTATAKGTPLPVGWFVDDAGREYARSKGFSDEDIDDMEEGFRLWWPAQPGVKSRKTDWSLTWMTWVRNEKDRRQHGKSGTRSRGRPGQSFDRLQAFHTAGMGGPDQGRRGNGGGGQGDHE